MQFLLVTYKWFCIVLALDLSSVYEVTIVVWKARWVVFLETVQHEEV